MCRTVATVHMLLLIRICNCGHCVNVVVKKPKKTERGCGERVSAPQIVSEERLSNSNSPILHLEISSGCESAGFQLGVSWPVGIIVASGEY